MIIHHIFVIKSLKYLLSRPQVCTLKPLNWFSNNYIKINSDTCHLILSFDDGNKKAELFSY